MLLGTLQGLVFVVGVYGTLLAEWDAVCSPKSGAHCGAPRGAWSEHAAPTPYRQLGRRSRLS